ncbi:MAG: hypothetical protein FJ308_09645 [Planctomycetes bacterium]|nr:hypothetical protein [Planctomycetota bacterium]
MPFDREPLSMREVSPTISVMSVLPGLRSELRWLLSAICFALAGIIAAHFRSSAQDIGGTSSVDLGGVVAGIGALAICVSVTLASIQWRRGSLGKQNPIASSLLTIAFRTLVTLGSLMLVAATKWPHRNSFVLSLLGCYFLFLILESGLSIRWYSSLTRVKHP